MWRNTPFTQRCVRPKHSVLTVTAGATVRHGFLTRLTEDFGGIECCVHCSSRSSRRRCCCRCCSGASGDGPGCGPARSRRGSAGACWPRWRSRRCCSSSGSPAWPFASNGDSERDHDRDVEDRDHRDRRPREVPGRDRHGAVGGDRARPPRHQLRVADGRRRARPVHAGRVRARRDRVHPGEERGAHDDDEPRHLRARHRRLVRVRLRVDVRLGDQSGARDHAARAAAPTSATGS